LDWDKLSKVSCCPKELGDKAVIVTKLRPGPKALKAQKTKADFFVSARGKIMHASVLIEREAVAAAKC